MYITNLSFDIKRVMQLKKVKGKVKSCLQSASHQAVAFLLFLLILLYANTYPAFF